MRYESKHIFVGAAFDDFRPVSVLLLVRLVKLQVLKTVDPVVFVYPQPTAFVQQVSHDDVHAVSIVVCLHLEFRCTSIEIFTSKLFWPGHIFLENCGDAPT